ncbi:MAG: M20/M25/M40 family metallo-hydrolase [Janthinobacterium lividum]
MKLPALSINDFMKTNATISLLSKSLLGVFFLAHAAPLAAQQRQPPANQTTPGKAYVQEIKALRQQPAVKKAEAYIVAVEPQTQRDHIVLTEIPAPPFTEQERAKKFSQLLQAAGADSVWTDKVGNVLARRKGKAGKKTVALEAHLDTVFPAGTPVHVTHKGDTLYAPGIGDDTRGLAVVLTVLRAMNNAGLQTAADVLFVGAVGEEGPGDLRGVKNLFAGHGPTIDSYIAIDGNAPGQVVTRGLGSHRYRVTFRGPGGHSSGKFGTVNPHNALARAIYYWEQAANTFTQAAGVPTTYNVGVIGGGTSVNSIPSESWMEVDMRSESPERLKGIDQLLQQAVQQSLQEENQLKRRGTDLTVDVKLVGDRPSGAADLRAPLVQRTLAVVKAFDLEPKPSVGSTNANIPFAKGIPAVTISQGGKGGNAHALDEWWVNEKGYLAIQQALLLLLSEAGVVK